LRSRMLAAYQSTPQGGSLPDFKEWALNVPGVTRAWIVSEALGAGTVGVYIMLDDAQSTHNGFPQGSNGVATSEKRGVAATGDQLAVANYIWPLQPVPSLVYAMSPTPQTVNFSISGVDLSNRDLVKSAISNVFFRLGAPGSVLPISEVWSGILSAGVSGFFIALPASHIVIGDGHLPVLGVVTWG